MKQLHGFSRVLLLFIAASLVMTSCGSVKSLSGEYVVKSGKADSYVFSEDNTLVLIDEIGMQHEGTYEIADGKINITTPAYLTQVYTFKNNGDSLMIGGKEYVLKEE